MEQQMVTTDEPCFENLPVEIKQHIFSYCGTKTRQKITLVCKDWAEALRYFHEDYFHIYLHHCYLRNDLEPVALLMNSTRRCHSLCLGRIIKTDTKEVQTRFFAHLGKEVNVLDLMQWVDLRYLEDSDFLLFFPKLKKLNVPTLSSLRAFKWFPKMLEHVHLKHFAEIKITEDFKFLRKIKNLKLLTSDTTLCQSEIFDPRSMRYSCRTTYTLDENLRVLLKSLATLRIMYLKCNTNFLDAPVITFNDVLGIDFHGPLSTFSIFNKFINLRSIRLSCSTRQNPTPFCFNFHQSVLFAGVEELEITDKKQSCIECFKSLIDSIPNVKKIRLRNCTITNQNVKYICFKLPNIIHLETNSHNLNHEIICHDQPEYSLGNLMQLETLYLQNFVADSALIHWPFMPNLKKVQFGVLSDDHGLTYFTEKVPNLESFEIDEGSLLSDTAIEIIANNWPNLRTLRLLSNMPCDLSPIKQFCRNLQTLELDWNWKLNSVHTFTSFFEDIPTLKAIIGGGPPKYRYLKEWKRWD